MKQLRFSEDISPMLICLLHERRSVLYHRGRRGIEMKQGPTASEQTLPKAAVKVCFTSPQKEGVIDNRPVFAFISTNVRKMESQGARMMGLSRSQWVKMREQELGSQPLAIIWTLEMLQKTIGIVCHPARITKPRPAPLGPVSTQHSSNVLLLITVKYHIGSLIGVSP